MHQDTPPPPLNTVALWEDSVEDVGEGVGHLLIAPATAAADWPMLHWLSCQVSGPYEAFRDPSIFALRGSQVPCKKPVRHSGTIPGVQGSCEAFKNPAGCSKLYEVFRVPERRARTLRGF